MENENFSGKLKNVGMAFLLLILEVTWPLILLFVMFGMLAILMNIFLPPPSYIPPAAPEPIQMVQPKGGFFSWITGRDATYAKDVNLPNSQSNQFNNLAYEAQARARLLDAQTQWTLLMIQKNTPHKGWGFGTGLVMGMLLVAIILVGALWLKSRRRPIPEEVPLTILVKQKARR